MKLLVKPYWLALIAGFILWSGCESSNPNWQEEAANPAFLHNSLQQVTDVIVHDIFSPPVAARIYAYTNVAAYEAMVPGYPDYQSLAGQLNGLTPAPQPEEGKEYCFPLAGSKALLDMGRHLIFSEDKIDDFESELMAEIRKINMPKDVYERSIAYGQAVARHIVEWSGKDNYKETRTFPKYTISDDPARWKPTPPDYMDAIEPHWGKIRPFALDSTGQFKPAPPPVFNMKDRNSDFFKDVMEVYEALNAPDREERLAIAKFWDCNPYVSHHKGHVMFAVKKITPGGHWMGITREACESSKADVMRSAAAYAITSVALADGFMSCWEEKFRSEVIRPETAINTYVDPEWVPALQTPPFPEYNSAHSVISGAAATALTSVFGDNFAYTDSIEMEFGMPPRSFTSFYHAAEEAAVSRLYGGIHYDNSCNTGIVQGKKVGQFIVNKLKMTKG